MVNPPKARSAGFESRFMAGYEDVLLATYTCDHPGLDAFTTNRASKNERCAGHGFPTPHLHFTSLLARNQANRLTRAGSSLAASSVASPTPFASSFTERLPLHFWLGIRIRSPNYRRSWGILRDEFSGFAMKTAFRRPHPRQMDIQPSRCMRARPHDHVRGDRESATKGERDRSRG